MRVCRKCDRATIEPVTDADTQVCRSCELERQVAEPPFSNSANGEEVARAFIEGSGWRLASTMLDIPHQYTVRDLSTPDARRTTALGHASFEWFVGYIRDRGVQKPWGPYRNIYLTIDEWEYWTMGYPVEETTVINRQAVGPGARRRIESEVAAEHDRRK